MTHLTRYKSFKDLKSSVNLIVRTEVDYSKEMKEFENFIKLLRKSSASVKGKSKKSEARDGR